MSLHEVDEAVANPSDDAVSAAAERFLVAAFYKFVALDDLAVRMERLRVIAEGHDVRGTVLLAEEGINGTVSGPENGVRVLLQEFAARVKSVEQNGAHAFLRSNFVGGIKRLPVRVQLG